MAKNKNVSRESNVAAVPQDVEVMPPQVEAEPDVVTELVASEGDAENGDEPADETPDGGDSAPIAKPTTVLIEVPVAPFDPSAFRSRLVTVRLSQRQADALKCIHLGLTSQHARLGGGGHVDKQTQAIQWTLEALADAIEKSA